MRQYGGTVSGVNDYNGSNINSSRRYQRPDLVPNGKQRSQTSDDGFSDALTGNPRDSEETFAKRSIRIQCCSLFMLFIMTSSVLLMTFFLAQDSDSMDKLYTRVIGYMDKFDDTGTLDTLHQLNEDYRVTIRPDLVHVLENIVEIGNTTASVARHINDEHVVQKLHDHLVELQSWMDHINHTLTQSALHFNINL
jgi:hypothetical protein